MLQIMYSLAPRRCRNLESQDAITSTIRWGVVVNDLFSELDHHGVRHVDCKYLYQNWKEGKKLLQGIHFINPPKIKEIMALQMYDSFIAATSNAHCRAVYNSGWVPWMSARSRGLDSTTTTGMVQFTDMEEGLALHRGEVYQEQQPSPNRLAITLENDLVQRVWDTSATSPSIGYDDDSSDNIIAIPSDESSKPEVVWKWDYSMICIAESSGVGARFLD